MQKGHKKINGIRDVRILAEEIAGNLGLTIKNIRIVREYGARTLRIIIDKPGGVTINDCENFSRTLSPRLDDSGIFTSQYYLEVSSPGIKTVEEEKVED